jgi:hypothetical protein
MTNKKETEVGSFDLIIHKLKEIQTNAEDAMSWTDVMSWEDFTSWIKEAYKGSWNLINDLEDIIFDLEEYKEMLNGLN